MEQRKKGETDHPKRDLPERTFGFARRVMKLCQSLDQAPGVSRTLANQLLRSGTSIGANVEERQGSQSWADFIAKYSIACKEARETNYWLRLHAASEIVIDLDFKDMIYESHQLNAILIAIIKKARKKRLRFWITFYLTRTDSDQWLQP